MFNTTTTLLASWPLQQASTSYLAVIILVNLPLLIIAFNVLSQLLISRDSSLPPVVFHWVPLFGSAASYGQDPINFLFKCREKYGNVFTFILFGRRMTVAMGPKGNNFVLGGKTTHVSAEEAYTPLTTPVFGKDVVYDVPNHILMEQKKFVKFGLTIENFREYVGMIEEEITKFFSHDASFLTFGMNDINEWGSFAAREKLSELIILTASRTLQGKEVRANLDATFAQRFDDLDSGFTPINLLFPNLPKASNRRRDKAQKEMSDFYVDIIQRREKEGADHEHDILAALADSHYKDGRLLSERERAHIMIALLMAGQHTSSATSSWALLHLANEPEVADAVYKEQVEHFGTGDGTFRSMTYDELKDLPVLDSIIRETLRMHPPIHSIMRKVVNDMVVPSTLASPAEDRQYIIPKGYFLLASPAVSQVDPTLWANADTWDPTRWTDPAGVAAQFSRKYEDGDGEKIDYGFGAVSKGTESPYQPFGAGRHRCIGEQFAYLQLAVIIATFVRNMEMKLPGKFPAVNYSTLITLPKNPTTILYRRRHFD